MLSHTRNRGNLEPETHCGLILWKHKYFQNTDLALATWRKGQSTWGKHMCNIREKAENELKWIVCRGEVYFRCDNWSQLGPLYKLLPPCFSVHNVMVKEILGNGKGNWSMLQNQPPNQIKVIITRLGLNLNNEERDKPVWSLASAGNFTVTSAWNICRHKGIGTTTFRKMWHKNIPFKMSFLTWRTIIDRHPADAKIARLSIPLSRTNNNIPTALESAEHISYAGEHAKKIWRLHAMPIGIEYTNINLKNLLQNGGLRKS